MSEDNVVSLGEVIDISRALDLKAMLKAVLELKEPIALDGSKINRIDACGLQLLLAFVIKAKTLSIAVQWRGCSEALKRSAELAGLANEIGCK
ncbi:MAG: STAS domain-containing protein [Pseudomonadota bacterium]